MLRNLLILSGFQKNWELIRADQVRQKPYWIVCGYSVYDVEPILNTHPGGDTCLIRRGRGETDCLRDYNFHSRTGRQKWEKYKVGEMSNLELERLAALRRQCRMPPSPSSDVTDTEYNIHNNHSENKNDVYDKDSSPRQRTIPLECESGNNSTMVIENSCPL